MARTRITNLLIFVSILLVAQGVLYQVNRLLQDLLPQLGFTSALRRPPREELEQWHRANEKNATDSLQHRVQDLLKEAMTYREEMEEVKGRVLELEREIREIHPQEERELKKENKIEQNLNAVLEFSPLKDQKMVGRGDFHVDHYFISVLKGRGMTEGPPELFFFPNGTTDPRSLCLRGNSNSDGTQNSYAFVEEGVPTGTQMVPGVTLVSDTFWDFINPWHSMFNLLQFVYWRVDSGCSHADNLLLFHKGEYRTSMGNWIRSVLHASGLPTTAAPSTGRGVSHAAMCFEQAIVSRSGIGGMKRPFRRRMFKEARCQARSACHIQSVPRNERAYDGRVNVTLMVRQGARGFVDEAAWQRVVKEQCEAALNCSWSVTYVANLTFCQQVEAMTYTDILVSAHGAQLTNIIFMEPGGSLLEMFPFGWLEMAGHGQFIYRQLATWLGLQHEGYWRDTLTKPCPNVKDVTTCFSYYKDQPIGINVTYIGLWLKNVIEKFKDSSLHILDASQKHDKESPSYVNTCECDPKQ